MSEPFVNVIGSEDELRELYRLPAGTTQQKKSGRSQSAIVDQSRARSASTNPAPRNLSIAKPAAPTPGSTRRSASRATVGSEVRRASIPSRAKAKRIESTLP